MLSSTSKIIAPFQKEDNFTNFLDVKITIRMFNLTDRKQATTYISLFHLYRSVSAQIDRSSIQMPSCTSICAQNFVHNVINCFAWITLGQIKAKLHSVYCDLKLSLSLILEFKSGSSTSYSFLQIMFEPS